MKANKLFVSAAVIGLMGLASNGQLTAKEEVSANTKGECHGINSCKGTGDCGGKGHGCAGKNACAGQGWKSMTKAECDAAKAPEGSTKKFVPNKS